MLHIYIYDISRLRVKNYLSLFLKTGSYNSEGWPSSGLRLSDHRLNVLTEGKKEYIIDLYGADAFCKVNEINSQKAQGHRRHSTSLVLYYSSPGIR